MGKVSLTEIKRKLEEKWWAVHLVAALVVLIVLWIGAGKLLEAITRHDSTVTTPDFTGMSLPQARQRASSAGVRVKVTDSVFVHRLPGGAVYRQIPKPGKTVKRGRRVFLVVNSVVPRMVTAPNLYGYSVTEAKAELQNRGLSLGRLNYVKDIATNNVLGQFLRGKPLHPGAKVVSGSTVDLRVGMGETGATTTVPSLVGLKLVRATDVLHENYLNVGRLYFDTKAMTYADSVNAVIWRQQDSVGTVKTMGSPVSFFLTTDPAKIPAQ